MTRRGVAPRDVAMNVARTRTVTVAMPGTGFWTGADTGAMPVAMAMTMTVNDHDHGMTRREVA
eukprot:7693759-Lingulodinium_polyedra.AAC.1